MIQEGSPRAKMIERLAAQAGSSPEEVAQTLLDEALAARMLNTPAGKMWGACSDPEEARMLDEIVDETYRLRANSSPGTV